MVEAHVLPETHGPNRRAPQTDSPTAAPMGDDDDDDDDDDTNDELTPPKYLFDVSTMDCVLDVRALCGLPQDSEEDGAVAFRALLLPKGKTLHIPDEPGCYATLGPWRMQSALALVHFVAATNRKPELLLAFVDYGMLSNGTSTGMFVMSLQLPLQKKRNVFEETPRFTKVADVSGFTSIDAKEQPWCAMLEPALKRQPLFEGDKLYSPADIISHLRKPLATRLKGLLAFARAGIAAKVAALARQDKRQAEKVKAQLTAQLDKSHEFLLALPPSKYDRRTEDRITLVTPEVADGVAWLTSPQRAQLQSGSAECKPTVRAIRRLEVAPDADAAAADPAAAAAAADPAAAAADTDEVLAAESSDNGGNSDPEPEVEPVVGAKRARKQPTHFAPSAEKSDGKKPKARQSKVSRSPAASIWVGDGR